MEPHLHICRFFYRPERITMKFCEGKIVELDPNKWYWLVVNSYLSDDDYRALEHLRMENGQIIMLSDINSIEFVENPERIKGIIIKEF